MKLLHRLLATVGFAALVGPQAVGAARAEAPAHHPGGGAARLAAVAPAPGGLDPKVLDRVFAKAFAGQAVDPERLAAMLPDIVARAIEAAPPGVTPAQIASEVARKVAESMSRAGVALDATARANLASEIVANVEAQFAARGVAVDRVALAAAALGGMGGAAGAGGYTAATGAAGTARDVSEPRDGANSAY
jgi:hypothetical protein